ncbi:MAG: hypothetical protein ACYDAY_02940 [Candidatus Dormibacteria bacterium]
MLKKGPVRMRALAFTGAALAGLLAGSGSGASAHGAPHVMLPRSQSGSAPVQAAPALMTYHTNKAPIEHSPRVYIDYWGAEWTAGWVDVATSGHIYTSQQAQQYIQDYFNFIGGSTWNASQTQYCSGAAVGASTCPAGATFVTNPTGILKGTWNDEVTVPPVPVLNDLVGAQFGVVNTPTADSEALAAEAHFGYSADANYMIFLPKGVVSSVLVTGLGCAYHADTYDGLGRPVAYTVMPWVMDLPLGVCGNNWVFNDNSYGNGYFDGYSIVGGHEFAEAETDPLPSIRQAWIDGAGGETGDKCAWTNLRAIGPDANGHRFAVQPLWSNSAGGCV